MILKVIFTITPAATSSITIPLPPFNRRSSVRMGTGFVTSSKRNRTNPKPTFRAVNGRPIRATIIPQISSITMMPGSFCRSICSDRPAILMEAAMIMANNTSDTDSGSRVINQQMGNPARAPKVPGAKGMYPNPQPLERNRIAFLRIVMARLYSLDRDLSRIGLDFGSTAAADCLIR